MSTTKKIPMRKCVGCQEMKNKKEMLRVLKTAEGEFILDATGRKNGRGAYLCFSGKCLQEAIKNKGLERSFKQAIPKEIYENLEKRQAKACQPEFRADRSGMCRCTSGAACGRCLLFWKIISERDNRR